MRSPVRGVPRDDEAPAGRRSAHPALPADEWNDALPGAAEGLGRRSLRHAPRAVRRRRGRPRRLVHRAEAPRCRVAPNTARRGSDGRLMGSRTRGLRCGRREWGCARRSDCDRLQAAAAHVSTRARGARQGGARRWRWSRPRSDGGSCGRLSRRRCVSSRRQPPGRGGPSARASLPVHVDSKGPLGSLALVVPPTGKPALWRFRDRADEDVDLSRAWRRGADQAESQGP